MSSENVGLLCSRSMSQSRLKVSVNVSLDDILCIAEPFVTKPSMVRHHYKPEHQMGFYLQGQGHSNWISVHTIYVTILTSFQENDPYMSVYCISSTRVVEHDHTQIIRKKEHQQQAVN